MKPLNLRISLFAVIMTLKNVENNQITIEGIKLSIFCVLMNEAMFLALIKWSRSIGFKENMSRLYRKEVIVSEDARKELTVLTNIYRDGPVREYRMNNDIEEALIFG